MRIILSVTFLFMVHASVRFKRDFMYVSDVNGTDADCFQKCNDKHKHDFEFSFNISMNDFYDFPLHPLVLQHSSYLLYCKLADQRTQCYQNECNDLAADTVFSPANFLCHFKRQQMTDARTCLSDAEPLTFLKCDQQCHKQISKGTTIEKVFSISTIDSYELELDQLCTFQSCYLTCMEPVVNEICAKGPARAAINLLKDLVEWHAVDIADWHVVMGKDNQLPGSCRQLGARPDPALQLISAA